MAIAGEGETSKANPRWLTNAEYASELRRKMDACAIFITIADQLLDRPFEPEPGVALEEWARATKTYRAVLVLISHGYGQQAQLLARSLFESAMLIEWALRHPKEAEEQVHLHALLALDLQDAARRRAGFWKGSPTPSGITREQRKRAVELFGRRGTAYWSGHRHLGDLVKENAAEIEDPHALAHLEANFSVLIRWADLMTHSTGISIRAHRAENPSDLEPSGDVQVMITGPSRHQTFDALHTAVTAYTMAIAPIIEQVAPEHLDELSRAGGLVWRAWKDPSTLRGLADDDPCPCDKPGTQWGTCHKWTESLAEPPSAAPLDTARPVPNRQQRRARTKPRKRAR